MSGRSNLIAYSMIHDPSEKPRDSPTTATTGKDKKLLSQAVRGPNIKICYHYVADRIAKGETT
jgi:hypothetical protein